MKKLLVTLAIAASSLVAVGGGTAEAYYCTKTWGDHWARVNCSVFDPGISRVRAIVWCSSPGTTTAFKRYGPWVGTYTNSTVHCLTGDIRTGMSIGFQA